MKTIQWISFLFITMLTASLVRAEEVARDAKIVTVQGNVIIGLPGESGGKPATVGALLPVGSTIHTTSGAEVTVKFFNSTVAVVQPDTDVTLEKLSVTTEGKDVTKENALLNLRVGSIISSLDPAKHDINNYGIRTPRGIAAARGTVYAVGVAPNNGICTTSTISGTVIFYTDKGEISVPFGNFASVGNNGNDGQKGKLDHLVDSDPKLAAELIAAIKSIADGIKAGTIPSTPGLLAALHGAASIIDPKAPNPVELPKGGDGQILPPLDQTKIIVSPSSSPSNSPLPPG